MLASLCCLWRWLAYYAACAVLLRAGLWQHALVLAALDITLMTVLVAYAYGKHHGKAAK